MNTTNLKSVIAALAIVLGACDTHSAQPTPPPPPSTEQNSCPMPKNIQWEVMFSPNGQITETIAGHIRTAKKSIFVQAYSFTSMPIAEALVTMHRAGLRVEVIVDKSASSGKGSVAPFLLSNGIRTYIDEKHAIAHNKIIIIDGNQVWTGSFNFTNAAEHNNAENSIVLYSEKIAETYQKNWWEHREHSVVRNP
jgi:phosphatidylserine/phosphatidylglycerophosphate/cardiolipin synthase-like enzyme